LKLVGWKLVDEIPPERKFVLIGAHHTSNWDWAVGFFMMAGLGLKPRWIGKDALFRGVAGPIMRWLGGIPVVRGARSNFVEQIADIYANSKELVIAIAPEGTRKYVDHWKTGFYHIAKAAHVSVAMGFLDYQKKICGIGGHFFPSENIKADMEILREFYLGVVGKFPENQGLVQLSSPTPN
jgi:1-acyl-sn-glycerol-3-phosphate acyltransferase